MKAGRACVTSKARGRATRRRPVDDKAWRPEGYGGYDGGVGPRRVAAPLTADRTANPRSTNLKSAALLRPSNALNYGHPKRKSSRSSLLLSKVSA